MVVVVVVVVVQTPLYTRNKEVLSTSSGTPTKLNKSIVQINYHPSSAINTNEYTPPPRAGGIISSEVTDQTVPTSQSNDSSAYNYGVPGTEFPTDSMGQVDQYAVEYKERPSVTGMFTETGPMGANIGAFEDLHDCNCVIVT